MKCDQVFATIQARIDRSNYDSAYRNLNKYIIQEQASLDEIYEAYLCPCPPACECRKHLCRLHWRLRGNVTFPQFRDAFLRMFVHRFFHAGAIQALDLDRIGSGRLGGVASTLLHIHDNWPSLFKNAVSWSGTLLCTNWQDEFWRQEWSAYDKSVYWAKQWAMLLPDTCVPYDSASRVAIRECTGGAPPGYFEMLDRLRSHLIDLLNREGGTVMDFRELDAPGRAGLHFDHASIALPHLGFPYSYDYLPVHRPLSRVIDKFFYSPVTSRLLKANAGTSSSAFSGSPGQCSFSTLSGTGSLVNWSRQAHGYHVEWGGSKFTLTFAQIEVILDEFFPAGCDWKKLGASETDPPPDGLGRFLSDRFTGFTPRHASAIATILVHEQLIDFHGKKPILLRRIDE